MSIKVGEIVKLKSGGPVMTVAKKLSTTELSCVWFDSHGVYQSEIFEEETLVVTEINKPEANPARKVNIF